MEKLRRLMLAVCLVLLFQGTALTVQAHGDTVVRVGFPIQSTISYLDENGEPAGYLVDYLEQLCMFTDWNIEYVMAEGDLNEQLSTLLKKLQTGEIDMMGTMNRNAALEQLFHYPSYSYGTAYTVLVVREDSSWIAEDFSHWDGMRIATCPAQESRMELFEQYAKVNGFTYEAVDYETLQDVVQAVRDKEVDAALQVDLSTPDGLRSIGRFSPSPYYFALAKEREDLLPQLNQALDTVGKANENLQSELYERYFRYSDEFRLSKEKRQYIESLGTLNVLFLDGGAPFQYGKDGVPTGFAVEYFDTFAQAAGLDYQPVMARSQEEAQQLILDGQVDLVGCISTASPLSSITGLRLTVPYWHSTCATLSGGLGAGNSGEGVFLHNAEEVLNRIQRDPSYEAKVDIYSINFYMRKAVVYDRVSVNWADSSEIAYTVAVTDRVSDEMLSILNQYAGIVSDKSKQAMLAQYVADPVEYSWQEWLQVYRPAIVIGVVVVGLITCVLVLYDRNRKSAYQMLLAENRALHLAVYDDVTGAYNGTQFRKLLEEVCRKEKGGTLVAFNIRNFKYINETYGVKGGDEVLCAIKSALDTHTKNGEFFCRQSSDLFYAMLWDVEGETVKQRVQALLIDIQARVYLLLEGYEVKLYSGAVSLEDSPSPFHAQSNLNYAMTALAYAKSHNITGLYLYDQSLHQADQLRQYIETHMESALETGEYQLYLQPKMNLHTGQIDGAEALVRWQSRERGMIFPDQFIPLFEGNGFCKKLDLYMVEQSCKKLREWMDQGFEPIHISINQTRPLFFSEEYVENLLAITGKYGVSPQYITLEILEGLAFENTEVLNDTIDRLNRVGFRVSMDDFGAGYSSLNTLADIHVDELKLDRLFLMKWGSSESTVKVMGSFFSLARELGIKTVAEGVEHAGSEELVRSMGCDYCQGYYYSKPVSADVFEAQFLKKTQT